MANIKSQIKRIRTNEKARLRNKAVRSEVKTRTKAAEVAAASGEGLEEATRAAISRIDRAVAKGVMHRNAGARKKSRLLKRLATIQAGESASA
jgi:small subunit ribosomal protein S20